MCLDLLLFEEDATDGDFFFGEDTLDVFAMKVEADGGEGEADGEDVEGVALEVGDDGEADEGGEGARDDVVCDEGGDDDEEGEEEANFPAYADHHTDEGGDAFAAFEAEVEGEHVSDDGHETTEEGKLGDLGEKGFDDEDGGDAFEDVYEADDEAVFEAEDGGGVGGAGVAGAVLADVYFFDEFAEDIGSLDVP